MGLSASPGRSSQLREVFLGTRTLTLVSSGRRQRAVLGFSRGRCVLTAGTASSDPTGRNRGSTSFPTVGLSQGRGGGHWLCAFYLECCCFPSVLTFSHIFLEPLFSLPLFRWIDIDRFFFLTYQLCRKNFGAFLVCLWQNSLADPHAPHQPKQPKPHCTSLSLSRHQPVLAYNGSTLCTCFC